MSKSKDRVVVVTGAAAGIGLGITKEFVRHGYPVAMLDMQTKLLEQEASGPRINRICRPRNVDCMWRQHPLLQLCGT